MKCHVCFSMGLIEASASIADPDAQDVRKSVVRFSTRLFVAAAVWRVAVYMSYPES